MSPDGKWVAFVTASKLAKMALGGGPVIALADVADPRGMSWDLNDWIVYSPQAVSAVYRISPGGGAPQAITTLRPGIERSHRRAQLLPTGKAVVYTVGSLTSPDNYDGATIEATVLDGGARKTILQGAAMARYAVDGTLIFVRGNNLFAVDFDPEKLAVSGTPRMVLQGVGGDSTTGASHFSVSASGSLVYFSNVDGSESLRPMWVNQSGRAEPLSLPAGVYANPALSPDGGRLAICVIAGGGRDIWVYNFERQTFTRLTFGGQNHTPVWSRDGSTIYYATLDPLATGSAISAAPLMAAGMLTSSPVSKTASS
ncbi:hypothetical protein BH18ACI5_BH18ACI5_01880 [soil metagenome]